MLISLVSDIKFYRLSNRFIIGFLIGGFVVAILNPHSFLFYFAGFLAGLLFGFLGYALRIFGAGDGKLFGVSGLFLGIENIGRYIFFSMVIAGIMAAVIALQLFAGRRKGQINRICGIKIRTLKNGLHGFHMVIPMSIAAVICVLEVLF